MLVIAGYILLTIYCAGLVYITAFSFVQLHLLWKFRSRANTVPVNDVVCDNDEIKLPFVTIQLPLYNEEFVASRLIDNIMLIDYPRDRFEVQVLDDSDDNTVEIARAKTAEYRARHFNIEHIRREERKGYKAGALQYGMGLARGEFIAIFDADFLPRKDFLKNTIPEFKDPTVAVVQTRWEHLNQDFSLITKMQAFQLNVHFSVEQGGRQEGNYMLQFNGTAGIWRRSAIDDAGGWHADTLTEDLDLSYRAQLLGWKIRYLENIGAPAELPAEMNGLKSQQYRWMKGGAETARKLLPDIWKSKLPLAKKIHATSHLMSSTIFVSILVLSISSVPVMFFLKPLHINPAYFSVFLLAWIIVAAVFYAGNANTLWKNLSRGRKILNFLSLFPVFISLSMGMSLHNTIAVIQGYRGKRSAFIRTPKFNIRSTGDRIKKNQYTARRPDFTTLIEGLLALYFSAAIVLAFVLKDPTFILFHSLLAIGFGSICYYSIRHLKEHS